MYRCAAESKPETSRQEKAVGIKSSICACARLGGEVGTRGGTWGLASAMAMRTPPRHDHPAAAYTRGLRTGERSVTRDTLTAGFWVQILAACSTGWGQTA